MHWFSPRSIGAYIAGVCGHLRSAAALLFFRYGAISSMPRFLNRSRSGSESYAAVGDDALRLLPRAAFRARHADFGERGLRKLNFSRGGTFQPNSQRKTLTVDQYHPLRALATLGFADCGAPFFAGAKLPSRKVSSHLSKPPPSSAPSSVRHASSQTPCSSHCFNRRQHVEGEGNSSGRKRHAAPVCRTQRMPSKQARFDAHGRPRLIPPPLRLGKQGLNQLPLLIGQQLLPLLHDRSSSAKPPQT